MKWNETYIASTCKWQTFNLNIEHLLCKPAESHVMPGTNCLTAGCNKSRKHTWISIFKIPKAKPGIPENKNGMKNIWTSILFYFIFIHETVLNQHHAIGYHSCFYSCNLLLKSSYYNSYTWSKNITLTVT